jgi:uncharacterized protein YjbJ (UPF0337 family)
LQQIVDFAVLTVEGCDAAGISLLAGSRVTTPVYSHPLALEIDSVQYDGEAWDIIRRPFWMSLSRGRQANVTAKRKRGNPCEVRQQMALPSSHIPRQGANMTTTDKAKNTAQQAKGKLKETVGKVSGNNKLRAEGKADQVKGNVKQAGEKLKDAFKK